jgi:hypothetical protein
MGCAKYAHRPMRGKAPLFMAIGTADDPVLIAIVGRVQNRIRYIKTD